LKEDYIGRVRVILVLSDSLSKARIMDGKERITKKSRVRK
jgi:hypothetical protein